MNPRVSFERRYISKFVIIMFAAFNHVTSVPNFEFNISRLLNEHEKVCLDGICPSDSIQDAKVITSCDALEYCYPCQCDENCMAYDDCCPNYLLLFDIIRPTAERVCIAEKIKTSTFYRARQVSYYMINSCPIGKGVDGVIVDNCVNKTSSVVYPPVTSLSTSETYANMYCAICNNDTLYTEWGVDFRCPLGIAGMTSQNSDLLIDILNSDDCTIGTQPQIDIYPRSCVNEDVISECNVTGLWIADDMFLRHACSLYKDVYLHPSGAYRNVFCLICNGYEYAQSLWVICGENSLMFTSDTTEGVFDVSTIRQSLKAVSTKCPPGSWYDRFMRTCLRVYCSKGRVYDGITCKSIIKQVHGLNYKVKLSVKVDRDMLLDDIDSVPYYDEMYKEFARHIDDIAGNNNDILTGLQIQNNYLHVIFTSGQMIFQNIVLESFATAYIKFSRAEMDDIEETLLNNTKLDFIFHSTVINETVRSKVSLVTEFAPILSTNNPTHYIVRTIHRLSIGYYKDLSPVSICAHLEIMDFQIDGEQIYVHGLNSSLANSDVVITNNTLRLCKRDYEDLINPQLPLNQAVQTTAANGHISIYPTDNLSGETSIYPMVNATPPQSVQAVVNGQSSMYYMVNIASTSISLIMLTICG